MQLGWADEIVADLIKMMDETATSTRQRKRTKFTDEDVKSIMEHFDKGVSIRHICDRIEDESGVVISKSQVWRIINSEKKLVKTLRNKK